MVSNRNTTGLNRRTFLGTTLASLTGLSAVSGTAAAYHELEDDYGTVVDVVDAGADPSGDEPITPVLTDVVDDDTLLKFPDGRYYMDRKLRFTDFENLGIVGKGDATLVPADFYDFADDSHKLFRLGTHYAPGHGLHIENFTVDFTANNTGVRAFEASVADDLVVKNVDVRGRHDSGMWSPGLFRITDPDGSGLVDGFRAPDGAAGNASTPADFLDHGGPSGIICNWSHRGSLTFRNCVLGGFPDNGLYAAGGDGEVRVEGGHYANSGTASIRLGCDYGHIEGTTVTVDADPFGIPQEGIRLDYGDWHVLDGVTVKTPAPNGEAINIQNSVDGATIRNSSITMGQDANVGVQINRDTGPTYLVDTDIRIDGSNNAVRIEGTDAGEVGLANVSVSGDADGGTMRHAIYCERDDCDFRGLTVDQPGGDQRRGIALLGDDAFLYDCTFTCTQRGISLLGDDAWINDCYSDPYADRYSVKVYDGVRGTRFKNNTFPGGIVWQ